MFNWFEKQLDPYPEKNLEKNFPRKLIPFIWSCTKEARLFIGLIIVFVALLGIFEAMLFSILGNIVDWLSKVAPAQLWVEKKYKLLLLAGILFTNPWLVFFKNQLIYQTLFSNFPMRLRWIFHRYLLNQSVSFYQNEFAGRIATKVMQTALAVRDTIMPIAEILVFVMVFFTTILMIIGSLDPWLLPPFIIWLILYIMVLCYFVPQLGKVATEQANARALMTGRVTDAYNNIATVKLFSYTYREAQFTQLAMKDFIHTAYKQMRLVSSFDFINHILIMALIAVTAGMSLWFWMQNQLSIGAVAAATAMALRLNGMSHWVMWEMAKLFENIGIVKDGMQTLTQIHTVVDIDGAKALQIKRGEIHFENVYFTHGKEHPVINQISLHIRSGEKIGLIGRSGAGKSTLVNLLLRFYNLEGGRILIDGQDIAQVTQESLRAQIGVVTQDTALLHRSVRENLLYGKPDASEKQMIAAAYKAHAHDFIQNLSDHLGNRAYDAYVGERGVKLSGGQQQRIAIARLILKDAPILVLDEATSALDSEVEAAIQENLYAMMEGKTVLAIAHRLSTIAAMDRLIVLDNGRIAEEGDHATLLAKGGLYAKLWRHQSGGFLKDE